MAGVIKLNPETMTDERDALAAAWNEALRLVMADTKFTPVFEATPEQQAFFKNTAYATNSLEMKRTIVARIATMDTSVSPTPEQEMETLRLLALVAEMIGSQHPDAATVAKMAESVKAGGARGEVRPAPTGETAQDPELAQAAAAGGDAPKAPRDFTDAVGYTLAMLPENEGFDEVATQHRVDKPNKDGSIPRTVGHGITRLADGTPTKAGDRMDRRTSLTRAEEIIVKNLIPVAEQNVAGWDDLDPRLQAAMLDTAYNVGADYFTPGTSPRMLKRFRDGEDPATVIAEENATWHKANGKILNGLVERRARVKEKLIDWFVRDRDRDKKKARS